MTLHENSSILSTIIAVSEKLEASKLDKSVMDEVRPEIQDIASYLDCDELAAIFFVVIFVLQNQRQTSVNLHAIAEFLDYSFLHILEFRKEIDVLEKKNLIYMDDLYNISHHPENNGYRITGTVMNNVIDGEPIVFFEENEETTESVLSELHDVQQDFCERKMSFTEFKRQICNLERKYAEKEFLKNINKLFPDDFDSRSILYSLCFDTVIGENDPDNDDDRRNRLDCAILRIINPQKKYVRRASLFEDSDILIKNKLSELIYETSDEYFRGKPRLKITLKLTADGIRQIFGSEAELYIKEDMLLNETDKTVNALHEFGYVYEDEDISKYKKRSNLRKIEQKHQNLPFFKRITKAVRDEDNRFFLYDCAKDFLLGGKSSIASTLNDLYGHSEQYFTEMRSLLDETHPLVKKNFIEIEKNEVIENSRVTVSDKTVEFLYGKNADIYMKTSSAKNVIDSRKINEKHLFYSEPVQKQIDMLSESLVQKNLEAMQNRLEEKGLPKGIAVILYGAPGTGKTETAYQLARQTKRKILHVDIADSKSMWFGESEKKIKKIFTDYRMLCKSCRRHRENTPILLFNEADALISKRRDVSSGSVAQTENAMQNILLEEMEKLEGIMIATTNLCENMDKAFERRFLFKVKYEKPSLEARTKIWKSKMNALSEEDAEKLAGKYDFSGGEIDNIVRKCEMNEIIKGKMPSYEELVELCETERLEKSEERRMGFCA